MPWAICVSASDHFRSLAWNGFWMSMNPGASMSPLASMIPLFCRLEFTHPRNAIAEMANASLLQGLAGAICDLRIDDDDRSGFC